MLVACEFPSPVDHDWKTGWQMEQAAGSTRRKLRRYRQRHGRRPRGRGAPRARSRPLRRHRSSAPSRGSTTTASCCRRCWPARRPSTTSSSTTTPGTRDNGIDLRTGEPSSPSTARARPCAPQSGTVERYDKLLIATGSRPDPSSRCPGADLPGVVTFRDLDDVDAMLAAAAQGRQRRGDRRRPARPRSGRTASPASGMKTTVVHLMPTLMERQLDRRRLPAAEGDREARHRRS